MTNIEEQQYDPVGYVAAFFLCLTLIPQLYHTYKMKQMDQISWYFIIISSITCLLFLIYGILLKSLPIIIANSILGIQTCILITFKIKYK